MQNKELAQLFKLTAQLMELHGENSFKARSYANVSFRLGRLPEPLKDLPYDAMQDVDGIGAGMAAKIMEILETGELKYMQELLGKTPPGVLDMLTLKGIGPKKIAVVWKELGAETIGELLYACNENRLIDLKGFGAKTQEQVRQMIQFKLSNTGKVHYASIEAAALKLEEDIQNALAPAKVSLTGSVRRKDIVIDKVSILAAVDPETLNAVTVPEFPVSVDLISCTPEEFPLRLFETTGSPEHLSQLETELPDMTESESDIYAALGLPFIVPEMREGRHELAWAKTHNANDLVKMEDLKGILHNHSTWSDGRHSLREMAEHCRDLGYEYLGICDHSRSAFYANGLDAGRVLVQQQEIDSLNDQLAPFRIFKGIESDILNDGSLDYGEDILATFDFVVASVHSNLRMPKEKAMQRLLTAIENPFTTILGHPTGRLLLSREGYPIDHKAIIDACAAHKVVIELNANPLRLDIDWTWIHYAMGKGVQISINPDAHSKEGYHHMYYGVCAARKGGLIKEFTLNALSGEEIEVYFHDRLNR